MSFESDLNAALNRRGKEIVRLGAAMFRADVAKQAPRDTGNLADGLTVDYGSVRRVGNLVMVPFASEGRSSEGFDYPEFLNKVARVMPTRRRYLRWMGPDGPVFSRGFVNVHRNWWKSTVTLPAWRRALKTGA